MVNVVLMRAAETVDPYEEQLIQLGSVSSIPVINFNFVNLDDLKVKLSFPGSWSGLIFTSKRGLEAVKLVCESVDMLPWQSKLCYVVGEATHETACGLGLNPTGKECGNADTLSRLIVTNQTVMQGLPLLFVCGQLKKDTLPKELERNNLPFQALIVYETVANPDLHENISSYIRNNTLPSHIVFFSPSGYKFSIKLWKALLGNKFDNIKMVAIGRSTADIMCDMSHPVLVADKPNPSSLYKVISESHQR